MGDAARRLQNRLEWLNRPGAASAIDVAPLLDLNEDRRCTFRAATLADPVLFRLPSFDVSVPSFQWNAIREPTLWRWGSALYALVGLLIMSLAVLTVTGVFRRAAER